MWQRTEGSRWNCQAPADMADGRLAECSATVPTDVTEVGHNDVNATSAMADAIPVPHVGTADEKRAQRLRVWGV